MKACALDQEEEEAGRQEPAAALKQRVEALEAELAREQAARAEEAEAAPFRTSSQFVLNELGYAVSRREKRHQQHERSVQKLLRAEGSMQPVDTESGCWLVPSAGAAVGGHLVCLADGTCTCTAARAGLVCAHLEAKGGGAAGCQARAERFGAAFARSGSPLMQETGSGEFTFSSTSYGVATMAAARDLLHLRGSSHQHLRASRQVAVASPAGLGFVCSCPLFACHGGCMHVEVAAAVRQRKGGPKPVAQLLRRAAALAGPGSDASTTCAAGWR
ncbi:hypothetical protein HYH03_007752 [Edaphochlamys debaryana]|uniref:SWIM-type domain-containing protein n=1 Tax=Edaphochlamys debaryana TaxID=47281 RepID=A0A836C052_9CHLO|nr:hypothetical protein HYH03_007752 [Edaphochlamys debaryana]|eukprot:KAG2494113.1 hypothetical protein HYH03_007752 [Edaphochlamys debaryana]